jgi:hypothetical protein
MTLGISFPKIINQEEFLMDIQDEGRASLKQNSKTGGLFLCVRVAYFLILSVANLYSVKSQDDRSMTTWKGSGRMQS